MPLIYLRSLSDLLIVFLSSRNNSKHVRLHRCLSRTLLQSGRFSRIQVLRHSRNRHRDNQVRYNSNIEPLLILDAFYPERRGYQESREELYSIEYRKEDTQPLVELQ